MSIKALLYDFMNNRLALEEYYLKRGTVTNINETEWTCDVTPIDGESEIKGVRLKPTKAGDALGLVEIPADGTGVLVAFESKTKAFLLSADEVDKIIMRGGANGSLINISDLVDKLNNLESQVNDVITKYNAHTHTYTPGPGTTATPLPQETGSLTPTAVTDIEDDKITH